MSTSKECAQIKLDASLGAILAVVLAVVREVPPCPATHCQPMTFTFPFSAMVGQDEMKLAILVAAIAPGIGGVLVFGDRGTGKSTAVRALPTAAAQPRAGDVAIIDEVNFGYAGWFGSPGALRAA